MTLALAKGRLLQTAIRRLRAAGVALSEPHNRALVANDASNQFQAIFIKDQDVPLYVEYGIADVGICGKDNIWEKGGDVYELLDLKFGTCNMVVAGKQPLQEYQTLPFLKVATKYPNIATDFFYRKGVPVELIKLSGSVELGAVLGLSDVIVDIVKTGRTLKENNLHVLETIAPISARLIVNRASFALKRQAIETLCRRLKT
ncbi:MAG: ATP phosphoribosyltransferase [Calditrichaeota bacterium]|nr:ATP phosphoribosyltransferase [Calditrichota bacterium]